MSMKKSALYIVLCITILLSICGCAKIVSVDQEDVEVKIVYTYHRSAWTQPIYTGKTMSIIYHPEKWRVDVIYNGQLYSLYGSKVYQKCKGRENEVVKATLTIEHYDNGNDKQMISKIW